MTARGCRKFRATRRVPRRPTGAARGSSYGIARGCRESESTPEARAHPAARVSDPGEPRRLSTAKIAHSTKETALAQAATPSPDAAWMTVPREPGVARSARRVLHSGKRFPAAARRPSPLAPGSNRTHRGRADHPADHPARPAHRRHHHERRLGPHGLSAAPRALDPRDPRAGRRAPRRRRDPRAGRADPRRPLARRSSPSSPRSTASSTTRRTSTRRSPTTAGRSTPTSSSPRRARRPSGRPSPPARPSTPRSRPPRASRRRSSSRASPRMPASRTASCTTSSTSRACRS